MAKVSKRGGFSDRNKIKSENTEIQLKDFDRRTRNQLQNMVSQFYKAVYEDTYYGKQAIQDFLVYVKGKDSNPALFVTLDAPHDRLKISGVEIRLRQLGRRLELERIHPHKFRRTMATRAIDKGMPIEQVQKILGHSQIDTTMQYAMVNQNNVKTSHQKYMS